MNRTHSVDCECVSDAYTGPKKSIIQAKADRDRHNEKTNCSDGAEVTEDDS